MCMAKLISRTHCDKCDWYVTTANTITKKKTHCMRNTTKYFNCDNGGTLTSLPVSEFEHFTCLIFARFVIKWFAEDWSLLGCYAFSDDGYLTTFQKNTLLFSRGPSGPKFWLLNNEYDGIIIHRNVGIYQSTRRHVPENLTVHIILNADIPLCFLSIKVKVKVALEQVMEAKS